MRVISNFDNRGEQSAERRVLVNRSEEHDVAELDPNLEVFVEMPLVLIPVFLVISLFRQICKVLRFILFAGLCFLSFCFVGKYWLFKLYFQNKYQLGLSLVRLL